MQCTTLKALLQAPSPCLCQSPSVYHCADDDGPFDGQIEFGTHSVCQCNFDGDEDDGGDGRRKRTFRKCIPLSLLYLSTHSIHSLSTPPPKKSHINRKPSSMVLKIYAYSPYLLSWFLQTSFRDRDRCVLRNEPSSVVKTGDRFNHYVGR